MPKIITKPVTGEIYHVFNRGVDKRDIFLDKYDYLRFYQTLDLFNSTLPMVNFRMAKHTAIVNKLVDIQAYALLPNHYHLLVKQCVDNGLSEFMRRISGGYASYFNERNQRSGALFQGVFKRVHIDTEEQYQYTFAYVNENHYVHDIKFQRELFHSSSLHYQKLSKSKLISKITENYSFQNNKQLAFEINKKRKGILQSDIFLE